MAATRVAAYVDALVAALDAALSVPVFDGPPLTGEPQGDFVAVGWSPYNVDEVPAVAVERDWSTGEGSFAVETFVVAGCAVSQSGDVDLSARRLAAAALLEDVAAVVDALSVTGAHWGRLRDAQLTQSQTSDGSAAGFDWSVQVSADA